MDRVSLQGQAAASISKPAHMACASAWSTSTPALLCLSNRMVVKHYRGYLVAMTTFLKRLRVF